jgi:putative transposase
MGRVARIVLVGSPHHIIQRGSRNQNVFFNEQDREVYISYLKSNCIKYGVKIWAWCLMSNHVHFVAIPEKHESFANCFGRTHLKYARRINFKREWCGHLWQERFRSSPMDEAYLLAAVRYAERNPVRAKIVEKAWDYRWSSAAYHVMSAQKDPLVSDDNILRALIGNWKKFLEYEEQNEVDFIRKATSTCRPIGSRSYIEELEK